MQREHQINRIKKLQSENREWICARDIMPLFEISLEELLNAYNNELPVYDSNLIDRVYPTSLLDDRVLYTRDACVYGCINYNSKSEIIYLSSHNLPEFIKFDINEISGMWRLSVDNDELDQLSECKFNQYDENHYTIHLKLLYNFSGFTRKSSNIDIDVRAIFTDNLSSEEMQCDGLKIASRIVFLTAHLNNRFFYGVPVRALEKAQKTLGFAKIDTEWRFSIVSDIAYNYFFDIASLKNGEYVLSNSFSISENSRKYNISFNESRSDLLDYQNDLYIKIVDMLSFISKEINANLDYCISKWEEYNFPQDVEKYTKYKEFAIGKFKGMTLKELFETTLCTESSARSEAAKDTYCGKFGARVKKFAKEHDLPIWPENRGRPAGRPS